MPTHDGRAGRDWGARALPYLRGSLDLSAVANLRFPASELLVWWRDNLALARRRNARAEVLQAIEGCLAADEVRLGGEAGEALAQEQLQRVLASRSWRLTAPMRNLGTSVRRIKSRGDRR